MRHMRIKFENTKQDRNEIKMPSCPWSHGLLPKILSVIVAVPPVPVRVPSQRPVAPSVSSVMSVTNDKGDNEIILGLCTDLLAFAL